MNILEISPYLYLEAGNGGLFRSTGKGMHQTRIIDTWELIYVDSGTLHMAENGIPFRVQAGQTLLLAPGRLHGGTQPYDQDLTFYWFHFTLHPGNNQNTPYSSAKKWSFPQQTTITAPDRMRELAQLFLADQEISPHDPVRSSLMLLLILRELQRPNQASPQVSPANAALAQRADTWMRAHLHEPISTSEIANALHVNSDHLGRVCKRVWGHSLTDQIHRLRIARAKRLLTDTDQPIGQLLSDLGFQDSAYFRRLFRRHTGLTPSAYRRHHTRIHINTW